MNNINDEKSLKEGSLKDFILTEQFFLFSVLLN